MKASEYLVSLERANKGRMILGIGRSGSGKSAAWASFPGKKFVFDFDHRIEGLLRASQWIPDLENDVEFEQFGLIDMPKLDGILAGLIPIQINLPKFPTIIFDSIGSFNRLLLMDSIKFRGGKGQTRGNVPFTEPSDFQYASMAWQKLIHTVFLPMTRAGINVLVSGWVVDRWGKPEGKPYDESIVIGERLLLPDKLAEELPGYFNEVYYFRRVSTGIPSKPVKFTVEFNSTLARSALISAADVEITNRSFFEVWQDLQTKELK